MYGYCVKNWTHDTIPMEMKREKYKTWKSNSLLFGQNKFVKLLQFPNYLKYLISIKLFEVYQDFRNVREMSIKGETMPHASSATRKIIFSCLRWPAGSGRHISPSRGHAAFVIKGEPKILIIESINQIREKRVRMSLSFHLLTCGKTL